SCATATVHLPSRFTCNAVYRAAEPSPAEPNVSFATPFSMAMSGVGKRIDLTVTVMVAPRCCLKKSAYNFSIAERPWILRPASFVYSASGAQSAPTAAASPALKALTKSSAVARIALSSATLLGLETAGGILGFTSAAVVVCANVVPVKIANAVATNPIKASRNLKRSPCCIIGSPPERFDFYDTPDDLEFHSHYPGQRSQYLRARAFCSRNYTELYGGLAISGVFSPVPGRGMVPLNPDTYSYVPM